MHTPHKLVVVGFLSENAMLIIRLLKLIPTFMLKKLDRLAPLVKDPPHVNLNLLNYLVDNPNFTSP